MIRSTSLFNPLRNPVYRAIWVNNLLSNVGGMVQLVAAGWTMTIISGSPEMVTLVQSATAMPVLLFSMLGGALADSRDRRRIMMASQSFMMAISAMLAALTFTGFLTPWSLLLFTFLIGCGTAFNNPSWHASVGNILDRQDVPSAVTLNSMAFNVTRSVGPAIGGVIVATLGAAFAFALNAVSYIGIIIVLFRWRYVLPKTALPRESLAAALNAGLRYAAMSPNLLTIISRGFLFGIAAISVMALLPLVARDLVSGGPVVYGALLGSFGGGAVLGALLNSSVRRRFSNERIALGAMTAFSLSAFLLSVSHVAVLSCCVLVVSGLCWIMSVSLLNVSVQLSTPRWVVGRSLSFYQMSSSGGMALGAWFWGSVATAYGPALALGGSAVAVFLVALFGLRFSLPEVSDLDLDPLDSFREPLIELQLMPRSGPIKVTVEYHITESDLPAFLTAMAAKRRIRLRDGARHWVLLRNLSEPGLWTEAYHVSTWAEYIRHNQRRLKTDQEVSETLRALHRGPDRPRVQRWIEREADPGQIDLPVRRHDEDV